MWRCAMDTGSAAEAPQPEKLVRGADSHVSMMPPVGDTGACGGDSVPLLLARGGDAAWLAAGAAACSATSAALSAMAAGAAARAWEVWHERALCPSDARALARPLLAPLAPGGCAPPGCVLRAAGHCRTHTRLGVPLSRRHGAG